MQKESVDSQWRSDGGAGRTGRHLLAAAKGRKTPKFKKKSHEYSDCKFHMCLRARKTKRYGQRVAYLSSAITLGPWLRPVRTSTLLVLVLRQLRETYALNRLSSFRNLRRKGGKFDHRPGRPKALLRHCRFTTLFSSAEGRRLSFTFVRLSTRLLTKSQTCSDEIFGGAWHDQETVDYISNH